MFFNICLTVFDSVNSLYIHFVKLKCLEIPRKLLAFTRDLLLPFLSTHSTHIYFTFISFVTLNLFFHGAACKCFSHYGYFSLKNNKNKVYRNKIVNKKKESCNKTIYFHRLSVLFNIGLIMPSSVEKKR